MESSVRSDVGGQKRDDAFGGNVREPGAVERMLFDFAFMVPMMYSLSLTSLLRAFDE